jgi:hypothetical protein
MKPKAELVRVVRSPEGTVSVDLRGKAPGRGAYVCRSVDCLKKALRSKALSRSLEVEIPPEVYDLLTGQMEESDGTGKG